MVLEMVVILMILQIQRVKMEIDHLVFLEVVMEDRFDNRFSQTLVRTVEFASVATDAGRHCVCRLGNMRTLTAPPPA